MSEQTMTPEAFRLLAWISTQKSPVTHQQMREQSGIGYSKDRVSFLYDRRYIDKTLVSMDGREYQAGYYIIEDGRLALDQEAARLKADADEQRTKKWEFRRENLNTLVAFAALVIAILALLKP